ncbi:MAG: hypothetical protein Q4G13_05235 [Moraxella sp.]|nr:hypothetical protein [Moraxella sp.]
MKIIIALLALVPMLAHANNAPKSDYILNKSATDSRMEVFRQVANALKLRRTDFSHRDLIEEHQKTRYTIHTTPNTVYHIAAVCDSDCMYLNIDVVDTAGNTISQGFEYDSALAVKFTAKDDNYQVQVSMDGCFTQSCFIQVEAFTE